MDALTFLSDRVSALSRDLALQPVMGAEIECYAVLAELSQVGMDTFWRPIQDAARAENIPLQRIEKERGEHQYELVLGLSDNPLVFAAHITQLREMVIAHGDRLDIPVSFAAKPFAFEASSGLHLHLHLRNDAGENILHKTDDYISPHLYHLLGGICALSPYVMPILYPNANSYARMSERDHVARNASWGSNNRSCAVRIPYTQAWDDKRVEWRLPCADADATAAIALLLHAAYCGMKHAMIPPAQTFGLADKEKQDALLPNSLEEAMARMEQLPELWQPLTPKILREWCG